MKRRLPLILLTFLPALLFAEPIDSLEAKQIASVFMTNLAEQTGAKSGGKTKFQCLKEGNIFILNNTNGGWALVSADDCVRPILAYSPDGEFSIDNISPAAKDWFDNYNEQIYVAQKAVFHGDADVQKEWEQLRNGRIKKEATQYAVEPLIKTQWGQDPYYNKHCPTIDGKNALTGCVATAMAQVMNYWQWPKKGIGFYEYQSQYCGTVASIFGWGYDWDDMPNQLDFFTFNDDVAYLMFDCGVSVDMDYGLGGSGAYPTKVKDAMVKYFKYSPKMTLENKDDYEEEKWINKLKNELNNGIPILYYGDGTVGESGHAFICDGYSIDNSNCYFHFNWGWCGSSDGYYLINSLETSDADGQSGSNSSNMYSRNQQAYFGVMPSYEIKEYDLKVYDDDLLAFDGNGYQMNTLWLGDDIYFRAKIANYGDTDFSGMLAVAVFDSDRRFVSQSDSAQVNLPTNTYVQQEFKIDGSFGYATDKRYFAVIMYKDNLTDDWAIVSDNLFSSSTFDFDVNYSQPISINSPITVYDNFKKEEDTAHIFIRGDEYTCTIGIVNNGNDNYVGGFLLSLINTKGDFIQKIDICEQNQPLRPNETRNIMFRDTIDAKPGTYLLNVSFWNGEGWTLSGAVNGCFNPILFDVKEEFIPDQYEDNNSIENAYVFPLEFDSDNNALVITKTENANLHKYGDVDYYKFDLGQGYNYLVESTILNNKDGKIQTTSDDVTVEYSYDGKNWFKGYDYEYRCKHTDDDRYDKLEVNGGGNVYVKIYHPWGMKGTYMFLAGIVRSCVNQGGNGNNPATAVSESAANAINIYAAGNTIVVENATDEIFVYNAMGTLVARAKTTDTTTITVNDQGVYIVKTGSTVKRVMVN